MRYSPDRQTGGILSRIQFRNGHPYRLRRYVVMCTVFPAIGCAPAGPPIQTSTFVERQAEADSPEAYIRRHYTKTEYRVPMRDGALLSTTVYAPRDATQTYPFLLFRTPYSCRPYGEEDYRETIGPNMDFARERFIFVYQDVRGRFMSEGRFVNMRPHLDVKSKETDIDESSDTYDTIEWLLSHIPNHNGKVGMWGISYPGFYAAAGMIDAHPALAAVSPQAPIADWWYDDFHHHGAFFLPHAFNFLAVFGRPRSELTGEWGDRFDHETPDGYQFFMDLGSLENANLRHFHGEIDFWNKTVEHPNYDEFWQRRNILPHLHRVAPAVMTVGGWFDAEDLYGSLQIYRAVERKNPDIFNILVMGPWRHGGWSRTDGDRLGHIDFGAKTSYFYRKTIELPFFIHFLKGRGVIDLPEAFVFETGVNRWRRFDAWPPADVEEARLYAREGGVLSFDPPGEEGAAFDEFVSDPNRPVPFTEEIATGMTAAYMTDDQRFAARRPDVCVFQTDVLESDLTLAGPVTADLWVSTSGTASDWIVKLIDVFPPDAEDPEDPPPGRKMGGYQMMVRSEVVRGRFRNNPTFPEPFKPNEPTRVVLELQDVLHTFREGHRILVQIQSTWFPLVDRNPHRYVDNVFLAKPSDFIKAIQRVYRSQRHATFLRVGVLPADEG
ncbi:MAG: CocE/NonD family hydrolase [Phycisphaerae bacterium]